MMLIIPIHRKGVQTYCYRHPFMVLGSCGTLHLKSIGYKTFPDMFDERYDDWKTQWIDLI